MIISCDNRTYILCMNKKVGKFGRFCGNFQCWGLDVPRVNIYLYMGCYFLHDPNHFPSYWCCFLFKRYIFLLYFYFCLDLDQVTCIHIAYIGISKIFL